MRYIRRNLRDSKGKRYKPSATLVAPILDPTDLYVQVGTTDRLDTLAHKYYGDTGFWWIIAKANGIKGKVALPTDEMIRIPSNISQIVENFKKINNIG